MSKYYQVNFIQQPQIFEEQVLILLYGAFLEQKLISLIFYFRNLALLKKNENNFSLSILTKFLKIDNLELEQKLQILQFNQLIEWKFDSSKQLYVIHLKKPKTIEEFLNDQLLINQVKKKLSQTEIDQILETIVNINPKSNLKELNVIKKLQLPNQIKQKAKLHDLYMINKLYAENAISISILQKIVDFVWVKTASINGTYLEKIFLTLKIKKILNHESKLTLYLLNVFRNQPIYKITSQFDHLPAWIAKNEEKKVIKKHFNFQKIFNY